jgi:hypothetical protein
MLSLTGHGCACYVHLPSGGYFCRRRFRIWMVWCFARGLAQTASVLIQPMLWYAFHWALAVLLVVSLNTSCSYQTSQAFLECFRNNLLDIRVDPRPYGTHSFRREGCQYLHVVLKWSFRQICNWGGWTDDFDNPGTIFKYLLSWNDNPDEEREHYMNPARPGTDPCQACGRTCHCA